MKKKNYYNINQEIFIIQKTCIFNSKPEKITYIFNSHEFLQNRIIQQNYTYYHYFYFWQFLNLKIEILTIFISKRKKITKCFNACF